MLENIFGSVNIKQHSDFDTVNKPFCAGLDMDKFLDGYDKVKRRK